MLTPLERAFTSGAIVDVALVVLCAEAVVLAIYRMRTGRGLALGDFAFGLAAGACLMLALRARMLEAAWPWQAFALTAAGLFHLADVTIRLRRRPDSR